MKQVKVDTRRIKHGKHIEMKKETMKQLYQAGQHDHQGERKEKNEKNYFYQHKFHIFSLTSLQLAMI